MNIEKQLSENIAGLLYLEQNELDNTKPFTELGLDSILGVELIKLVNKTHQLNLKTSKLYDYPTVKELAEYIESLQEESNATATSTSNKIESPIELAESDAETSEVFEIVSIQGKFEDGEEMVFTYHISIANNACLRDHLVFDHSVMPTDGYVELLYSTFREHFGIDQLDIQEVHIHNPLTAQAQKRYCLQLILKELSDGRIRFIIKSYPIDKGEEKLTIHTRGFVSVLESAEVDTISDDFSAKDLVVLSNEEILSFMSNIEGKGIYLDLLTTLAFGQEIAKGTIDITTEGVSDIAQLLDSSLGCAMKYAPYRIAQEKKKEIDKGVVYLPYRIASVQVFSPIRPDTYTCWVEVDQILEESILITFRVLNSLKEIQIKVCGLELTRVTAEQLSSSLVTIEEEPQIVDQKVKETSSGASSMDIAVVGMACRLPKAINKEVFWENLKKGIDAIEEIDTNRWGGFSWFDPDPHNEGTSYSKWGGFIEDSDKFDPLFFGISPGEAEIIDPQQRIFLEECWACIEDGGYTPSDLTNRRVGVFVGAGAGDYLQLMREHGSENQGAAFMGNSQAILAARISYFLNLKGPSLSIDTACSSSLVAIDRACKSIVSGESELAIAGGVSLLNTPIGQVWTSQVGMPSKSGRCKTFDVDADGIVSSEGVGVLLLKPLKKAVLDGDRVYGVIKGSGVNQDGKTNGITAPSAKSQSELEHSVYEKYNLDPNTITYIEAHGTGTKLGDPIEVDALTESFKKYTDKTHYCALGSVKTNIGHTGFTAGVAGVIKTLFMLKHKQFVPHIHYKKSNSEITLEGSPFYINTEFKKWKTKNESIRRAAISSFGFSGTNAHLVIEEYNQEPSNYQNNGPALVVLSAKDKDRLTDQVSNLLDYLKVNLNANLHDIAYTLQIGRAAMEERLAFVVSDLKHLNQKLLHYKKGNFDSLFMGNSKDDKNDFDLKGKARKKLYRYRITRQTVRITGSIMG